MDEAIIGAVIGAAATILAVLAAQSAGWLIRRGRRRTFALALAEEIRVNRDFLSQLLGDHPLDDSGDTTDIVMMGLAGLQATDHLFVSLLPNLDVLPPDTLRELSAAHARLKMVSGQAEGVLQRGGSGQVGKRETRSIWEAASRLVDELGKTCDQLSHLR